VILSNFIAIVRFVTLDLYNAFVVFNCNGSYPILAKIETNVSVVSVVVKKWAFSELQVLRGRPASEA
jgi:hypothetical protein